MIKKHSFYEKIIPTKLIVNSNFYFIKILNYSFIIDSFDIYTKDEKIDKIIITKGKHPNCNPIDQTFCIPSYLKNLSLTSDNIKIIKEMLKIFNFDNAHYVPWFAFEYSDKKGEKNVYK